MAGNLAELGAGRVSVLGAVGADGAGVDLRRALSRASIESDLLVESPQIQTFTYNKLINCETGVEDLPRVDFVNTEPLPAPAERAVVDRLEECLQEFNAIIVADQAETVHGGTVTAAVREAVCRSAGARGGAAYVADSRRRLEHFRGVIATPNESEAAAACRRQFGELDFGRLHRTIGGAALVVTDGKRGARLIDCGGERLLPAPEVAGPVDPCGAGDSLTAGLALALAAGARTEEALRFGTIVAGVTVGKPGTGKAAPGEVLALAATMGRSI